MKLKISFGDCKFCGEWAKLYESTEYSARCKTCRYRRFIGMGKMRKRKERRRLHEFWGFNDGRRRCKKCDVLIFDNPATESGIEPRLQKHVQACGDICAWCKEKIPCVEAKKS